MFATERGVPLTRSTINKLVERAGKLAGLAFPVRPHMLRHACGFALANKRVDTRTIQDYLGTQEHSAHGEAHTAHPHRFRGLWR